MSLTFCTVNEERKIVCYTTILIDKLLERNNILCKRTAMNGTLIDVTIPWFKNIVKEEKVRIQIYQVLTGKIGEIYETAVQMILFVVSALKTIHKIISTSQDIFRIADIIGRVRVAMLIGTARVLKKICVVSLCCR